MLFSSSSDSLFVFLNIVGYKYETEIEINPKMYPVNYPLQEKGQYFSAIGGLVSTKDIEGASITVGMRVGNEKFDNTNYFDDHDWFETKMTGLALYVHNLNSLF